MKSFARLVFSLSVRRNKSACRNKRLRSDKARPVIQIKQSGTPIASGDNQLGGKTLNAGVYSISVAITANLIGTLTLDAQGDHNAIFIIQCSSTLVTASASSVVLINGAQACHVFWVVDSSATLGTHTDFVGNIILTHPSVWKPAQPWTAARWRKMPLLLWMTLLLRRRFAMMS